MSTLKRSCDSSQLADSLVFVGFGSGLTDPNFGALLDWIREAIPPSGLHHYRLCRLQDAAALWQSHCDDDRFVVLPYGKDYDDFESFSLSLVDRS